MSHVAHCTFDEYERRKAEDFFDCHEIDLIRIVWCDVHGLARGKVVSRRKFFDELHQGITFSIASLFMDLRGDVVDPSLQAAKTGWTSCYACPELETLHLCPTEPRTAEVLAHLHRAGDKQIACVPRTALDQVLGKAARLGFHFLIGSELEFYLLEGEAWTVLPPGKNCYRLLRGGQEKRFLTAVQEALQRAQLNFEATMFEDGPGQCEIVLFPTPALQHADQVFQVKTLIKSLAAAQGLTATFLSKPVEGESGSGYHIHQTLVAPGETHSLFDESRFGELATTRISNYTAGQLIHFPELSAFLLPTVNAYKRIRTRGAKPLALTWGEDNRTVALRVLGKDTLDARVENRVSGGEANPYLAIATSIAAGVQGMVEEEALPPATEGNAFENNCDGKTFPANLGEALDRLEASQVARSWLGHEMIDHFVTLKRSEWERFLRSVTDWEKQEYVAFL
ncbi:MAG: glutamine synthetase [Armatimonadetes bacterium]|nr:glutamine synthetase [Armatimonadota bacterium]